MPISRLQFELGIDAGIEALMVSVYDLLDANRDTAYSEEELYDLFTANAPGSYIDTSYMDIALQKVVELGAVEQRAVANSKYYAFRQEIDTATWELPASDDDEAGESEDETDVSEPDSMDTAPEEPAST
ncbi:MAG: hypothetical protein OXT51_07605 [Chloroflexota bacterium]|nr:hypothetical protein [Chloroflexota bacterium]